jgi:signal transduction histidine kinase
MRLDPPTLFASATLVIAFAGGLLLLSSRHGEVRNALLPWGVSILLGATGLGVMSVFRGASDLLAYGVGNALIIGATGAAWAAARAFGGLRTPIALASAGGLAWLGASLLPVGAAGTAVVPAALCAAYLAAAAWSMWRGGAAEPLPSRGFAVLLLAIHAGVVAARALDGLLGLLRPAVALPLPGEEAWPAVLLVEAQLHTVGMAMALLAMAKERAERRAGAALVAARDAAAAASDAKSRFVAHLSHELRTPMNGVLGMAQALAADPGLTGEQKLRAETLERAGRHLVAVAGNVLDLAKAEAGRLELERRPVGLAGVFADCEALTRPAAEARGHDLRTSTEPGLPAAVLGDPTRLRQVLLNFLSNAVKFTPPGGRVELRATRATGEGMAVRIEVTDSGPGIPETRRGRLFAEYSQLGGAGGAGGDGGTGLGLSICMVLARAMGGRIGHGAGPGGRGSSFWIELPGAAEAPRAVPPLEPPPAAPLRVLIVDDIAANRLIARLLLQRAGHEAGEAASSAEAVEAVAAGGYDAVLMDVYMPGLDGLEATRRIRALGGAAGRVPVIGLTADVRPERWGEYRAAGMDACLPKPLDRAAVLGLLARLGGMPRPAAPASRGPARASCDVPGEAAERPERGPRRRLASLPATSG